MVIKGFSYDVPVKVLNSTSERETLKDVIAVEKKDVIWLFSNTPR